MWLYVYRVFVGWAGILLGIDGAVALIERYLGEYLERFLHRKPRVPGKYKLWFAALVLIVAQGKAYFDMQETLIQAGKDNDALHSAINSQQKQVDDLKSRLAVPQNAYSQDARRVQDIRNSLAHFIDEGTKIRDRVPLGDDTVPPDLQPELRTWRGKVFQYLTKTLDAADAATFASYEVKGYPENYNLMQQIGDLEDLLKQSKLRP